MDKNDLRSIRTEKQIKEALFELIHEKGFDKVTVRDLTNRADICRSTFYAHYEDKFDMIEKIEDEFLIDFQEIINKLEIVSNSPEKINVDNFRPIIVKIYKYIYENKEFFNLFLENYDTTSFLKKFYKVVASLFHENFFPSNLSIPNNYALALLIGSHSSLINEWIRTGMKETPEEMAAILEKVFSSASKNFSI